MKSMINIWMSCLIALLLVACQDENPMNPTGGTGCKLTLSGEIEQLYLSRVNDNGFADGDEMGVYVVDYVSQQPGALQASGNRATNVKHTFDEANFKWTSAYDIFFRDDKTPVDIYGYYPYSSTNPENPASYAFRVQQDQQTAAHDGLLGGYEQSDFLWGKVEKVYATDRVIRLPLKHRLSNVRVTLKEGEGFSAGEWAKLAKRVLVQNTTRQALINLSTGEAVPQGEAEEAGILPYEHEGEYRAIVVPQTVGSGKTLFSITVGSVPYTFSKETATMYEAGKMSNFTIQVNKKSASGDYEFLLTDESITPWEADNASHEATMKEYVVIHVPEAGTLEDCIAAAGKDMEKIKNLKVTGTLNRLDFSCMSRMLKLSALNLKEARVENDYIPWRALSASYSDATLYYLVLPDKLKEISDQAFQDQPLSGSLIIPEGVVKIGRNAFAGCTNFTGTLSLPSTVEKILEGAFQQCNFACELYLPKGLKEIGDAAFYNCKNLYGNLVLPEGLSQLGESAFANCTHFTGDLSIPSGVKEIGEGTFSMCQGLNGRLTLPDGLEKIGATAFSNCNFRGELVLPQNLESIDDGAFMYNSFSGELKLPASLLKLGSSAFACCSRISGTLEIPQSVTGIQNETFYRCTSIEKLVFPSTVDVVAQDAFKGCSGLGGIVCNAVTPPYVESGAFEGVPKDNFAVEVPMASVNAYGIASGWNAFKRIVAHRELVCRPYFATALNAGYKRTLVLDAEGDWEVKECPSWCHLDRTSGSKKTELTLTIDALGKGSGNREGDIVFLLKGKDYTTDCHVTQYDYPYAEDEVVTLQKATRGKGVNLVFIGDGYSAKDISEGTYLKDMNQQVKDFFGVEPYTTYRDYFNVYTAIAMSQESGVGTVNTICHNKFGTIATSDGHLQCGTDGVFGYALLMPTVTRSNLSQTLIVLTPNTTDYGGITQLWSDGSAIALTPKSTDEYPYDSRGIVQHEAGGHGFGKLGDEYISYNDLAPDDLLQEVREGHARQWYLNLSETGKAYEVPWAHFISHEKYRSVVDVYEGGFGYTRGIYRSEPNSCMSSYVPYFNAVSREAIVKRIKQYAGETYSFADFVKNDNPNTGATGSRSTGYEVAPCIKSPSNSVRHRAPIIHRVKPRIK